MRFYCLYLLGRNRSLRSAGGAPILANTALVILMGLLWMLGMFFYGVGASRMGERPRARLAVVHDLDGVDGQFLGNRDRRMEGSRPPAYLLLQLGNVAMVAAFIVISAGSRPSS